MGRYYDGDIEGKFWFGVQSSQAPENLGAEMMRITYQWSDRDALDKRIKELESELGDYLPKMDKFFGEGRKVLLDIKGLLDRKAYENAGYLYWRL